MKSPDRRKQTLLLENSFKEFTGAPVWQTLRADSTDERSRFFCWLPKNCTQPLALTVGRRGPRAGAWTRAGTGGGGSLSRCRRGRGGRLAHLGALGRLLGFGGWGGGPAGGRAAAGAGAVVGFGGAAGAPGGARCRATTGARPRTRWALRPRATSWPEERGKER